MIDILIGIAIGAAFAPFWMKVWAYVSQLAPVKAVVDFVKSFFKPTA